MWTYNRFIIWVILYCVTLTTSRKIMTNYTDKSEFSANTQVSSVLPCPDPESIAPCICTIYSDLDMEMDCSGVKSEVQLRQIFNQTFPFKNFQVLMFDNNSYIKYLRDGDFGEATFEAIDISQGILEVIESNTFSGSALTLRQIAVHKGILISFPFEDLPIFTKLKTLVVREEKLFEFPDMISQTITSLDLSFNLITSLPSDALANLPNIESFTICENFVNTIFPGTFTKAAYLRYLDLGYNNLTSIAADAIQLNGTLGDSILILPANHISEVEVNAIKGVTGTLVLDNNRLTELKEEVWKPIMESVATFLALANPLLCGCDIAWLILNPTYMSKLDGRETCSTGDFLTELDPAIYEQLC